ncbi:sigma 54-interacting transcriptional regulator [Brevibacillus daliensis]|uniref:sigma 54-interacting transcriptional regulator n=1 Tax=Brevibacillus daliensis TaxID=2892995 RepID=UPI001E31F20B|nr:sigma 54-interacting transcriptional regulator [Brevibacillus daliensis]
MHKMLIIGAGKGGSLLLTLLMQMNQVEVIAVVDTNMDAPGLQLADQLGIKVGNDYRDYLDREVDIILEATGDKDTYEDILQRKRIETVLIPGTFTSIIMKLIQDREKLIQTLSQKQLEYDTMLNSTHDAIVAMNQDGLVTIFNRAAERLIGQSKEEVIGTRAEDTIPNTRLHHVLKSGNQELNQEQQLSSQTRIITNRVPVRNEAGEVVGAVSIFRDITEIMSLAEEVTDLKELKSMLQGILHSSDEAISVVDGQGNGILINPAYTRITGLTPEDVIDKPATVDISEGESMHMQVLRTKKPVRGVRMKLGPMRKDVVVNVAPVLVDGELKGSVGVIHDISEIKNLSDELEKAKRIIRTLEAKYTFDDIIGKSEKMLGAIEQAKLAAMTPATVILRGESGTGKELFAHAIHNGSKRKYNQFIRVNCASLTESLLESELFGYEEGAFTGAKRGGKRGLFEEASGGTIFLDEIGELSMGMQAKLLRVLQEKEIVRVGGTKAIPIDVRIIGATHVDMEKAIKEGKFREDLYYRLHVLPIAIPPLRERLEDIIPLTHFLLRKFNIEYGRNVQEISWEAFESIKKYKWPGNVRELENVLGRAMIHMKFTEQRILPGHLSILQPAIPVSNEDASTRYSSGSNLKEVVENAEKECILAQLAKAKGNRTIAAKHLGISLRNLYYKMEKLGILLDG